MVWKHRAKWRITHPKYGCHGYGRSGGDCSAPTVLQPASILPMRNTECRENWRKYENVPVARGDGVYRLTQKENRWILFKSYYVPPLEEQIASCRQDTHNGCRSRCQQSTSMFSWIFFFFVSMFGPWLMPYHVLRQNAQTKGGSSFWFNHYQ